MIEPNICSFLSSNLATGTIISWGKGNEETDWENGVTTVDLFKISQSSSKITPTYWDSFQLSVRNKYIDGAQSMANSIVTLFHLYFGAIGTYQVAVSDVFANGVLYEEEDIVHIPITLRLKYTQL